MCIRDRKGDELDTTVEAVVEEYKAQTKDGNIAAFHFQPQSAEDGYGADWHPSAATHDKAAEALSQFIKDSMGW